MVKVIDLFAGCGGLSLGAARVGLCPTLAIELDQHAAASHALNFPGSKTERWDLSAIDTSQITESLGGEVDAIIGGPPCQGFSVIGRNSPTDSRNDLLDRFFEIVADLRPKVFLMENVPGLLSDNNLPRLELAISRLGSTFNILGPVVLNAYDAGAATLRKRVVVAGYDPGRCDGFELPSPLHGAHSGTSVSEAFGGLPEPARDDFQRIGRSNSEYVHLLNRRIVGLGDPKYVSLFEQGLVSGFTATNHTDQVQSRFEATKVGQTEKKSRLPRLDPSLPAKTLRAGTGPDRGSFQSARPIHPTSPRVISVREAARIQGFPDWFYFHSTKWHSHRMIGNSVCPLFAETVLEPLAASLGVKQQTEIGSQTETSITERIPA